MLGCIVRNFVALRGLSGPERCHMRGIGNVAPSVTMATTIPTPTRFCPLFLSAIPCAVGRGSFLLTGNSCVQCKFNSKVSIGFIQLVFYVEIGSESVSDESSRKDSLSHNRTWVVHEPNSSTAYY